MKLVALEKMEISAVCVGGNGNHKKPGIWIGSFGCVKSGTNSFCEAVEREGNAFVNCSRSLEQLHLIFTEPHF